MILTGIAGVIALVLAIAFLGILAIQINEIPLWIIIGGGVILMLADFVQSLRQERSDNEERLRRAR